MRAKEFQPSSFLTGLRPEKADAREAILLAAEQLFAKYGFDATSTKSIAEAADVAPGLLHYYFKSKESLFEEMFSRRAAAINSIRTQELQALFDAGAPTLEKWAEALLRPALQFGRNPSQSGAPFSRLVVSIAAADDDFSKRLIEQSLDPTARFFIDALRQILPQLSMPGAVWGMLFAVGVSTTLMTRTGRAARLSDGQCDDDKLDEVMELVVPFVAAGLRALAENPTWTRKRSQTRKVSNR